MLPKIDITMTMMIVLVVISATSVSGTIPIKPAEGQIQPLMSGSTSSVSMVNGVTISAINASGGNKIITNLNYAGNGTAPSITVVATAIDIHAKNLNSLMSTLLKGGGVRAARTSSTGAFQLPNILTGSNILNAGWKSPASVSVNLEGNTTRPLHNANMISVQVFPFTG